MPVGFLTSSVISVTSIAAGKKYAEVLLSLMIFDGNAQSFGVTPSQNFPGVVGVGIVGESPNSAIYVNSSSPLATGGPAMVSGVVGNIAVDMATGKVWLGLNGTYYYNSAGTMTAGGSPSAGTNPTTTLANPTLYVGAGSESLTTFVANLRTQTSQFTGSIPSGFSAWYP
jgi:hypothetical protein